ncbi:MAG: universal stress protein [Alphaproteobacteria bacterium]|nr:universal stress protein [Alphaproteobacteria bacterium]
MSTGATASWGETIGHDATELAREGRVHDLIVLARSGDADGLPSVEAVEAALFGSGRPLLLVPPEPAAAIGESVVIGWNGSAEAARAVARALPLLLQAKKVTLVTIGEDSAKGPMVDRAALYLKRHGVGAETARLPAGGGKPAGEALLAEARRLKADMLVIGAYSHSRMREMVLGGVTRHMLMRADVRVFAVH